MENREPYLALLLSFLCIVLSSVSARLDNSHAAAEEVLASEQLHTAQNREALLARIRQRVEELKRTGEPPGKDAGPDRAHPRIVKVQAAATRWSMEVEGTPGEIASVLGGNLRSARISKGGERGSLHAALVFDSLPLHPSFFSMERIESWLEEQDRRNSKTTP
ncbi:MAG: hypothetical protein AAB229_09360 [Candidatus Hydrogenedentota bacterium]